jgi:hypothetical protein
VTGAVIEQHSLGDQERDEDRQERKAMPHQDLSATSHATDILTIAVAGEEVKRVGTGTLTRRKEGRSIPGYADEIPGLRLPDLPGLRGGAVPARIVGRPLRALVLAGLPLLPGAPEAAHIHAPGPHVNPGIPSRRLSA